jgi:hypothetical protein
VWSCVQCSTRRAECGSWWQVAVQASSTQVNTAQQVLVTGCGHICRVVCTCAAPPVDADAHRLGVFRPVLRC